MGRAEQRPPAPGWRLDQVSSAGRENLDPTHVARYDHIEDAGAAAEVALLQRLGLGPEDVVVDLGTGTGQLALAVAPHCGRVVAVDVEPADAEAHLEAWCATGGPEGGDCWSRSDHEEHVRDEHSTYTWVLEAMAERVGFLVEEAQHSADGIFATHVLRRPA